MYLDPKLIKISTLCLGVMLLLTGIQCSKSSLGFFESVSLTGIPFCATPVPSQPYSQSKPQGMPLSFEGGSPSSLPMPPTPRNPRSQGQLWKNCTLVFNRAHGLVRGDLRFAPGKVLSWPRESVPKPLPDPQTKLAKVLLSLPDHTMSYRPHPMWSPRWGC